MCYAICKMRRHRRQLLQRATKAIKAWITRRLYLTTDTTTGRGNLLTILDRCPESMWKGWQLAGTRETDVHTRSGHTNEQCSLVHNFNYPHPGDASAHWQPTSNWRRPSKSAMHRPPSHWPVHSLVNYRLPRGTEAPAQRRGLRRAVSFGT